MLATTAAEFGARGTFAGSLVFQGPQGEKPFDGGCQYPEVAAPPLAVAVAVAAGACTASPRPRATAAAPHEAARGIRRIKIRPSGWRFVLPVRHLTNTWAPSAATGAEPGESERRRRGARRIGRLESSTGSDPGP